MQLSLILLLTFASTFGLINQITFRTSQLKPAPWEGELLTRCRIAGIDAKPQCKQLSLACCDTGLACGDLCLTSWGHGRSGSRRGYDRTQGLRPVNKELTIWPLPRTLLQARYLLGKPVNILMQFYQRCLHVNVLILILIGVCQTLVICMNCVVILFWFVLHMYSYTRILPGPSR